MWGCMGQEELCIPGEQLISVWQRGQNEFPANTQRGEREICKDTQGRFIEIESRY